MCRSRPTRRATTTRPVRQRRRLAQRRRQYRALRPLARQAAGVRQRPRTSCRPSVGTHDLKFGFEFMNDRSTNTANGTSGPILYFDANGVPSQVRLTDYGESGARSAVPGTQASDYDRHYSLYGQDKFSINNRVTLTYGLRWDPPASVLQLRGPATGADGHLPAGHRPEREPAHGGQHRASRWRQL